MWMLIYIYISSLLPILGKKKKTNKQTNTHRESRRPVHLLGQMFQLCLNNDSPL